MIKSVVQQTTKRSFFTTVFKKTYSPLTNEQFIEQSNEIKDPLALILFSYNLKSTTNMKRLISQLENEPMKDLIGKLLDKNLEEANFDVEKGKLGEAFLFFEFGKIAFQKRDYEKCRMIFKKALEFLKNEDDKVLVVNNLKRTILDYNGQTLVHFRLLDSAKTNYQEGIQLSKENDVIYTYLYLHFTQVLISMLEFSKCKEQAEKIIQIIQNHSKNEHYYHIYMESLKILISTSIYFKNFDKAIENTYKGVELSRESQNSHKEIEFKIAELKIHYIVNNRSQFEQMKDHLIGTFKKIDLSSFEAKQNRLSFYDILKLFYLKDQEKYTKILAENYVFLKESRFSDDELKSFGIEQIYKKIKDILDELDNDILTKEILTILSGRGAHVDIQNILLEQLFEKKKFQECLEGCEKLLKRGRLDEDVADDIKDLKYDCLVKLGRNEEAKQIKDKPGCSLQ